MCVISMIWDGLTALVFRTIVIGFIRCLVASRGTIRSHTIIISLIAPPCHPHSFSTSYQLPPQSLSLPDLSHCFIKTHESLLCPTLFKKFAPYETKFFLVLCVSYCLDVFILHSLIVGVLF